MHPAATTLPDRIARARAAILSAMNIVVFTGAGASADSGIPTFRSPSGEGFWGKYSPWQLATPEGFAADPKLVYDWYNRRRRQLAEVHPNPAHVAISTLQQKAGAVVITQNIDGLHERVAPAGAMVLPLHGTIAADRCSHCTTREQIHVASPPELRGCPRCGRWMRPDVVWFGEPLDPSTWSRAEEAVRACDLMLVVGTSGEVWPAAGLVHLAAKRATVVAVNFDPGEIDAIATLTLHGRAAEIVPQLI